MGISIQHPHKQGRPRVRKWFFFYWEQEVEIPPSCEVKAKEVEIPPSQGKCPLLPRQAQAKPSAKGLKVLGGRNPSAPVQSHFCKNYDPNSTHMHYYPREHHDKPSSLLVLFINELALTPYHPLHTHAHTRSVYIPYPHTYTRKGRAPWESMVVKMDCR